MDVFLAHHTGGHIKLTREHEDCGWSKLADLEQMKDLQMFSPADNAIIDYLLDHKWTLNDF